MSGRGSRRGNALDVLAFLGMVIVPVGLVVLIVAIVLETSSNAIATGGPAISILLITAAASFSQLRNLGSNSLLTTVTADQIESLVYRESPELGSGLPESDLIRAGVEQRGNRRDQAEYFEYCYAVASRRIQPHVVICAISSVVLVSTPLAIVASSVDYPYFFAYFASFCIFGLAGAYLRKIHPLLGVGVVLSTASLAFIFKRPESMLASYGAPSGALDLLFVSIAFGSTIYLFTSFSFSVFSVFLDRMLARVVARFARPIVMAHLVEVNSMLLRDDPFQDEYQRAAIAARLHNIGYLIEGSFSVVGGHQFKIWGHYERVAASFRAMSIDCLLPTPDAQSRLKDYIRDAAIYLFEGNEGLFETVEEPRDDVSSWPTRLLRSARLLVVALLPLVCVLLLPLAMVEIPEPLHLNLLLSSIAWAVFNAIVRLDPDILGRASEIAEIVKSLRESGKGG